MMGRSDKVTGVWVYARDEITELKEADPNYKKTQSILNRVA